ncbi:membrane-flanked domain protein [Segniliparus rotundus DSM 44985]|uniref:Membrane-flanked domain protein n=1 Tax=Segniliparus rotundus (strain ATCC BAA-972 / CDC 1076 / CIP 108378 / DSM 44985 / JCM 13578) TaxID=640132 RepID=D6ZEC9_SEGRD|nr:PH domain-containing protein [Segniliparus rotundus]ADG99405.1 membrane-flanked domain protein [Segniliparus rotundus DSM 44985]
MASEADFIAGAREDWLASGERVVVEAKPHWKFFAGFAVVGLVLGVALAGLGFEHAAQYAHAAAKVAARHKRHGLVLEVVGAAVFLLFLLVGFARWRATRYWITDQRAVVQRGWIVRSKVDVPLGKVNALRLRQGIGDRVFGLGALVVRHGSLRPLTMRCVRDPHEARLRVHEGQRAAPLPPVGPRFASPPPQHAGPPFGATSPFATPPPPAAPAAPVGRFGGDGPPIPPWAKDED